VSTDGFLLSAVSVMLRVARTHGLFSRGDADAATATAVDVDVDVDSDADFSSKNVTDWIGGGGFGAIDPAFCVAPSRLDLQTHARVAGGDANMFDRWLDRRRAARVLGVNVDVKDDIDDDVDDDVDDDDANISDGKSDDIARAAAAAVDATMSCDADAAAAATVAATTNGNAEGGGDGNGDGDGDGDGDVVDDKLPKRMVAAAAARFPDASYTPRRAVELDAETNNYGGAALQR
jgi:hypothetical protein